MNLIQQYMQPGLHPGLLESAADLILFPSRWLWEEKSVKWIKNEETNDLKPVYRKNVDRSCCVCGMVSAQGEGPMYATCIYLPPFSVLYSATAIAVAPTLIAGLALKKISLYFDPRAQKYHEIVVEYLKKCKKPEELDQKEFYVDIEYHNDCCYNIYSNTKFSELRESEARYTNFYLQLSDQKGLHQMALKDLESLKKTNGKLTLNYPYYCVSSNFTYKPISLDSENYEIYGTSAKGPVSTTFKKINDDIAYYSKKIEEETALQAKINKEFEKLKQLHEQFIKDVKSLDGEHQKLQHQTYNRYDSNDLHGEL